MIFCEQCGSENPGHAKFCSSCGNVLGDYSETAAGSQRVADAQGEDKIIYAVLGWVFSGLAILFIPILFGAAGVIFGYLHRKIDPTHGMIIIIAGIACGLFGTVLGIGATY